MEYILFNGEKAKQTKYEGYYVTKTGLCVTIKVKGGRGKLDFENPRLHNIKIDKDGYSEVCLSCIIDGKQKRIYKRLHRLIWETFNGEIENDLTVDHIDNDVTNNNLSNLQILTREENGTKRHKKWVKDKMNYYKVYKNGIYKGVMNYVDMDNNFGIKRHDINKYNIGYKTRRIKELGIVLEKV